MIVLLGVGCGHRAAKAAAPHATAAGSALVESSGGKQLGMPGTVLPQPLVVQVNDASGNAVTGALVEFSGPAGVSFDPAVGLSDSSGQVSTNVTMGGGSGRFELTAASQDKSGKKFFLKVIELSAAYQQQVGYEVNEKYCARCHNSESSAERVSNYDNLSVKPHSFADGNAMNKLSNSDLNAIITHGGPALSRSALMPPYGWTLSKAETQSVIAYIRLVSDPPYRPAGVTYEKQ
jgi:mono/diheme cytochrome c family protein